MFGTVLGHTPLVIWVKRFPAPPFGSSGMPMLLLLLLHAAAAAAAQKLFEHMDRQHQK